MMKINVVISFDEVLLDFVERAISLLTLISRKETIIMSTLQEVVDDVASETTAIGSLSAFIQGLEDQIKAIPGITPAMQAQIDGLFASVESNKASIVAAMAVNVPPAPAPVDVPPVVPTPPAV